VIGRPAVEPVDRCVDRCGRSRKEKSARFIENPRQSYRSSNTIKA
jgi:hypothetical protein